MDIDEKTAGWPAGARRIRRLWDGIVRLPPTELGERVRWLAVVAGLVTIVLIMPPLVRGGGPLGIIAGLAGAASIGGSWVYGYRSRRFPLWADAVEAGGFLLVYGALPDPAIALGVTFTGMWVRALFGSGRRVALVFAWYVASQVAVIGMPHGWPPQMLIGLLQNEALTAALVYSLARVLVRHEAGARRERTLRTTLAELLRATDANEVSAVAARGLHEMTGNDPLARTTVAYGRGPVQRVLGAAGVGAADAVGGTIDVRRLPDENMAILRSGRTLWHAGEASGPQRAISFEIGHRSAMVVPVLMDGEVRGFLTVSADRMPSPEVEAACIALASGLALAFERVTEARRFRTLVHDSSDRVFVTDEGRTVLYEVGGSALAGADIRSVLAPGDREAFDAAFEEILGTPGGRLFVECQMVDGSGDPEPVELRLSNRVHDEAVGGVVVTVVDVRERRIAESERSAREAAEAANEAKNGFLSRMSHELRTPLNAILGFAQLLARDDLSALQRTRLGHVLKAGQHLLGLIDEVLDIARIEADRIPLSIEPVDVRSVISESADLMRPMAADHGVTVVVAGHGCAAADRQRLKQVILNLVSNGIKYNRSGGTVTVSTRRADGAVEIKVADDGAGISAEDLARLFTPFERLGAERTGVQGTGLGLALSKRLVEAMGGTLTVSSEAGRGTAFAVRLPWKERTEVRELAPAGDDRPGDRRTIVCIEDNVASYQLVESVLDGWQATRLIPAGQGVLGIDLVRRHGADLVLLDLDLPDIRGDEVLARLRSMPETRDVPVVVVSADASPARLERLLAAGATAYVTKPIDVAAFLDVLEGVLGGVAILEEGVA